MVRPILEYSSTIWSPYTKDYIHKMVQHRAARYVKNRYRNTSSVTSMLEHFEWEFLEARRAKHQITMLFKIIHDLVDIPANDYLTPALNRTRSQHSLKFTQIPTSSDYYKFILVSTFIFNDFLCEPRRDKTCLRGFRSGCTKSSLLSYRD